MSMRIPKHFKLSILYLMLVLCKFMLGKGFLQTKISSKCGLPLSIAAGGSNFIFNLSCGSGYQISNITASIGTPVNDCTVNKTVTCVHGIDILSQKWVTKCDGKQECTADVISHMVKCNGITISNISLEISYDCIEQDKDSTQGFPVTTSNDTETGFNITNLFPTATDDTSDSMNVITPDIPRNDDKVSTQSYPVTTSNDTVTGFNITNSFTTAADDTSDLMNVINQDKTRTDFTFLALIGALCIATTVLILSVICLLVFFCRSKQRKKPADSGKTNTKDTTADVNGAMQNESSFSLVSKDRIQIENDRGVNNTPSKVTSESTFREDDDQIVYEQPFRKKTGSVFTDDESDIMYEPPSGLHIDEPVYQTITMVTQNCMQEHEHA